MHKVLGPYSISFHECSKGKSRVATILQSHHWQEHLDDKAFSPERKENVARVLSHLTACRTGRLGSHLYRCSNCGRGLMGMDHCDDRHCVTCGDQRRDAWRQEIIAESSKQKRVK